MYHIWAAEYIVKFPVIFFIDKIFTLSTDVYATFVTTVELFLLLVEINEALITRDFDTLLETSFCNRFINCVLLRINFTARVRLEDSQVRVEIASTRLLADFKGVILCVWFLQW